MISPDQASLLYATAAQDNVDLDDEIALIQSIAEQVIAACQTAHIQAARRAVLGGADLESAILHAIVRIQP